MANQNFSSRDRLSKDTSKVIGNGKRIKRDSIVLYFLEDNRPRISVVISAKVANSVKRNKLKRWVREKFRKEKDTLNNYGIVIVFKKGADSYDFKEFNKRIDKLWKESGIKK